MTVRRAGSLLVGALVISACGSVGSAGSHAALPKSASSRTAPSSHAPTSHASGVGDPHAAVAIGPESVSVQRVRRTSGDLVVSLTAPMDATFRVPGGREGFVPCIVETAAPVREGVGSYRIRCRIPAASAPSVLYTKVEMGAFAYEFPQGLPKRGLGGRDGARR